VTSLLGRNLRARLTIFYASLLTAILLLYAVCVSAFFLRNLREQLDASLDRDVETVEAITSLNDSGQLQLSSHEGEASDEDSDRGYLLEVWGNDAKLLYRSEQLGGQALGPAPGTGAAFHREPPRSLRLSSGMRVRTISRVHHLPGGKLVMIRLAVSEEPLWDEFWEMVGVFAIGLPIAVVLVLLIGYLVAARALSPVDSMAKRAAEITADHLNERLAIANPDDELGQLGSAFNATFGRLENSFEQLRRFTADASHELRTPLTAIRSVGEVALQKGGDNKYYRDIIGSMLEEANRLTKLVESLLTMSRADAGRISLHFAPISLVGLAKESANLLEVLAEEKGQSIRVEGSNAVQVNADRTILRQALVNLIDNAVKFSPEKGLIEIRVSEDAGSAVVEVRDNGPGIPPEHRTRIFERFYRVDKARARQEGGTGLGLSIVEWAVAAHRGKVEVDNHNKSGSIFRVRLPRYVPAKQELFRGSD
jgi:heavy metal sensor kinase